MKFIRYMRLMPSYLKGVIKFKSQDYISACEYFEKAIRINRDTDNELLFQYYGQSLLSTGKHKDAFSYLSKAYRIYRRSNWKFSSDEEKEIFKSTLDALAYLRNNKNYHIEDFISPDL